MKEQKLLKQNQVFRGGPHVEAATTLGKEATKPVQSVAELGAKLTGGRTPKTT